MEGQIENLSCRPSLLIEIPYDNWARVALYMQVDVSEQFWTVLLRHSTTETCRPPAPDN
jgi:hypothetical protein